MKKGVSVILCCYNSESKLPKTLDCIAWQKYIGINIELVLIDNNSKDNTAKSAKEYWDKFGADNISIKIITENRPGLSYARDTGIKNANYDLVLFCDDDNWLDSNYCQNAYDIMSSDCSIGVLGGLNTAIGEVELPFWFSSVEQSYACGPQHDFDGEASRQYITGAGMVLRKSIFDLFSQVKFESQLTDRKGDELSSGGDSEICFIAVLLGFKLIYSSKLKLFHFMEEKRLNWNYFVRMSLGHAESSYKLNYYFSNSYKRKWLPELFRILKPIFGKRLIVLIRDFYYAKKGVVSNEKVHHMMLFGQILAHIKSYDSYSIFIQSIESLKFRIKKLNTLTGVFVNGK